MSYILDALKKSEAERSRGALPTLLTPPQTPFRSGIVGWVLIAVLIVNAGLLLGWLYWPTNTSAPARTADAAPPAAEASAPAPDVARVSEGPATIPKAASLPPDSSVAVAAQAPVSAIPNEDNAPAQGDADVSFSTHVYATDPSMRAVTMNGKRFVEGDTIRPGVRIREITETGVVLDVNGRPIPVDVLQDWR